MAKIKLKDGKVILRDGKVSCTCCDCSGPWGPGYDVHPNTVQVSAPDPLNNYTATRVLKCDWVMGDLQRFVQYLYSENRWKCVSTITGFAVAAYKNGTFSDGPRGGYTLGGLSSPTPLFTVT